MNGGEAGGGGATGASDKSPTRGEMEAVGERALAFRRYVLRRAYGTYYAVWASALFLYILVPYALYTGLGLSTLTIAASAFVVIAVGLAATAVTTSRFRKEAKAAALRRVLHPESRHATRHLTPTLWWAALIAMVALFATTSSLAPYVAIYGLLLLMDVQLYDWLRRSFQRDVPLEGMLAVLVYGVGAVSSLVISILKGYDPLAYVPWALVVAAWFFSALYALRKAPEEIVVPPD